MFEKDSDEYKMFGDFYLLAKSHYERGNDVEWYRQMLNDLDAFWAKYGVKAKKKYKQDNKTALLAYTLGLGLVDFVDNMKE